MPVKFDPTQAKPKTITITKPVYINEQDLPDGKKSGHKVLERGDVVTLPAPVANMFISQNQAIEGKHELKPGHEAFVKRWEEAEADKAKAKTKTKDKKTDAE